MRIAFGKWTPDRPGVSGNLTEAKNIYPTASGYASLNGTANLSDAASENLLTVFVGRWAGAATAHRTATAQACTPPAHCPLLTRQTSPPTLI